MTSDKSARFVVKHRVRGDIERTSGPYATIDEAQSHADDIRGFEGVEYAAVSEEPDHA